ncbi:phage tail tape measure protein [Enterococcus casseliflavus]
MATNLGNLAATASLNIDPFQQSTRVLETQMRSIDRALKSSETAFKNNSKNIAAQKNQYTLTGKQIQVYTAQLDKQKEKYEGLRAEIGDVNKATADQKTQLLAAESAVNKTAGQIESLTGKYNALAKEIAVSESNWTKSGKVLEDIGIKTSKVGESLSSVGTKMTMGVTVPIVAGVTAITKAAMDWESSFAGVKKTNDEIVDSNGKVVYSYDDLESGLRNLSKQLPSSHAEIASVAEAAGQLGIQTDNVVEFTKVMIDLGESTNLGAETAATELARFANITQMSQDKFSNLGSSIVDLGNNFATTESEISAMALRLAGAGSQIGMSEGDILGFAAALSSVGIEAEAGGSAFSKVMVNMQLAVENGIGAFDELKAMASDGGLSFEQLVKAVQDGGDEIKSAASKMGISTTSLKSLYKEADTAAMSLIQFSDVAGVTNAEFANMFESDPASAIMAFVEGLSKAEEQGTSAISVLDNMGITEVRLRDSLLRAANASGVFAGAVEMGNDAFSENTALAEEAGKRYETVESQLGMLKNEIVDVAIEFGGPFLQALREGVQTAKPFISTMADLAKKFSEANPETQQAIMKYIGLGAALGPATKLMGGFLKVTGGGLTAVGKFNQWVGKAATGSTLFGTAAANAAGSGGVGAMVTALGSGGLAGAMPAIIGAGGLLAVGYGAWKLFGEEAWNSAQRVKTWGTDVGKTTGETLGSIRSDTQEASGQFSLLEQGFSTDTGKIVGNFEKIGATIENELTEQINAFKESLGMLPEEMRDAAEEIVNSGVEKREAALATVEENNQRILDIKKKYVDEDGKVTIQGAKMIQDLMRQSTQEYLNITVEDAEARKSVMAALNGDVETASQEQAQTWLQTLGKQRQETKQTYTQQLEDYKKYLDDKGILNTDEGQQLVELFEKARDQSTQSIDAQMAIIAEKYPELAEQIFLANGQLISGMGDAGEAAKKSNQDIIKNAQDLSNQLAANAKKNADVLAWTADESTKAGEAWNSLQLVDKEGKIKTNANEIVTEATKDAQTWNDIKLLVHDADLDSNAKDVIGEAAIANGWWDGMAWGDKEAVLQDEFSITMYKALEDAGKWSEMSFEEKKAFLYSNTPEVMAETMLKLGLWEEFQPGIKTLNAENYNLLNALSFSESALNEYNSVDPDFKELLASDPATITYDQSKQMLEEYNNLSPELKTLLGQNTNMVAVVTAAQRKIEDYNNRYTPGVKHLNATSDTSAVDYMRSQINSIPNYTEKRVAVVYEGRNTGQYATNATGNPYFEGGLTWLGDGGKAEPYLTPQGQFGISPADWTMYDLPRGTKIWPSVQKLMDSLPRYANGTKFDDTNISKIGNLFSSNKSLTTNDTSTSIKIDKVISLLISILNKEYSLNFNGTVQLENGQRVGKWLMPVIERELAKKERVGKTARGER